MVTFCAHMVDFHRPGHICSLVLFISLLFVVCQDFTMTVYRWTIWISAAHLWWRHQNSWDTSSDTMIVSVRHVLAFQNATIVKTCVLFKIEIKKVHNSPLKVIAKTAYLHKTYPAYPTVFNNGFANKHVWLHSYYGVYW